MIAFAMTFILLVGIAVAIAFLQMPPKYADKQTLSAFNNVVLGVVLLVCLVLYIHGRQNFPFSDELRNAMALIISVGVEIVLLLVLFLLRNFWIFRVRRGPGSPL